MALAFDPAALFSVFLFANPGWRDAGVAGFRDFRAAGIEVWVWGLGALGCSLCMGLSSRVR